MEASPRPSSMNKAESFSSPAASAEESGWTIYFEDFFASEKREEEGGGKCTVSNSTVGGGSSLVSDAASCVAWKLPAEAEAEAERGRRRLSFKKRKARGGVLDDDSLEDTASSPVNSPKISEMNHLCLNQRKKDENRHTSQENCTEVKRDETVDGANECTELKKRGFCLVPLSMLVDYLG